METSNFRLRMALIVVSAKLISINATVIMTMTMAMLRNKTMIMTIVVIKNIYVLHEHICN